MKVNTDVSLLQPIRREESAPARQDDGGKVSRPEDRVTLSRKQLSLIVDENRSASETQLNDFKRAEQDVFKLKEQLRTGGDVMADIHQLDEKRVLFLSSQNDLIKE